MPPLVEDRNYGAPRAPIRQPPHTRGGVAGTNHAQPTYRSPYVGPPSGSSAPAQNSFSSSSHSRVQYGRVEPQLDTALNSDVRPLAPLLQAPSNSKVPHGRVEPQYETTRNLSARPSASPPLAQLRVQVPSYQPNGASSQDTKPQTVPYLFQRSVKFQAKRSAQSALGSLSQSPDRGSYPLQLPGQQQYHTPYNALRTVSSSGHGHDIIPAERLLYRSPPPLNTIYQPQPTSYSSPYYPSNTSQTPGSSRQPQRPQSYSADSVQVAISSYRQPPSQYRPPSNQQRPTSYQSSFPTMQASIYPSTSPSPASTPGPSSASKKRIGRPPGSKNKFSKLAMVEMPSSSPSQARRGRPSKDRNSSAPPSTMPKKRGRPFANAESAQKAREKAERKANPDAYPKKRGRPLKLTHQADIAIPEAKYIPFLCEWKGCQAELHNLETLRLHISSVHGRKLVKHGKAVRICKWGKCGIKTEEINEEFQPPTPIHTDDDANSKPGKVEFDSRKEWKDHIEKAHLIPFAWHMGDGPKATCLDLKEPDAIPYWLCDSSGSQVTPSATTLTLEGGFAKINNARRWAKEQRKLKINISEKSSGQYMKTEAQIVQEEDAEGEGVSGELDTGEEVEMGTSTGDDRDDGENEGGDENGIGGGNEDDMEIGDDGEGEDEGTGNATREGTGEDSGPDLMILDRL